MPDPFVRFARITLGVTLAVILWGAVVRATGSGAGCGSHWPLCDGEVVPPSPGVATVIELTHRATSGIALVLVLVLAVWGWRLFPAGHPARRWALASLVFMLGEAAIGAALVLLELVADNASAARAWYMAGHLGNTFLLLAALALTSHFAAGGAPLAPRRHRRIGWLGALAVLGTLVVGMSGAVTALGDTLFPAASLGEALRQDLAPSSHPLVRLRVLHPLIAVVVSLLLLYLVARVRATSARPARRWANLLNLLVILQLALGAVNVVLLAPVWIQLLHLLLADLLWIALVLTLACALAEPQTATETLRRQAAPGSPATAATAAVEP